MVVLTASEGSWEDRSRSVNRLEDSSHVSASSDLLNE